MDPSGECDGTAPARSSGIPVNFIISPLGKGIADLDSAIGYVTPRISPGYASSTLRTVTGHKGECVGGSPRLYQCGPSAFAIPFSRRRITTHERNTVTVFRVHVGLNFKHETVNFSSEASTTRVSVLRGIGAAHSQTIQHMVNAEVTQRGTEDQG